MSAGATQKYQHLEIETVLGTDALLIRSFQGAEQLGRLFEYQAEVVSQQSVDINRLVGTNATITMKMYVTPTGGGIADEEQRWFNAYISRVSLGECLTNTMAKYQITLVPWLWFLTRTSDCRIFQNKTIPDILQETFEKHSFSNFQIETSEPHGEWEYLVQYRETDFNFLNRLMEQEGIYYFFTHEKGSHTLVVTDSMRSHKPVPHFEELQFRANSSGERTAYDVNSWSVSKEVKPGIYTHNDFNFKTPKPSPNVKLLSRSTIAREHEQADYEIFDSPGEYETLSQGDNLSRLRMEELQSDHEVAQGQTVARGLFPGCTFKLKEHPLGDAGSQNRDYLLTKARYDAQAEEFTSGAPSTRQHFSCSFSCIPLDQIFRLPRTTPKPVISGPQTAMVVGPKGEEIYTDEYGRVKVQFHWDRHGKYDAESSCWIRVSQGWAGINWGSITLPRVGQEVIVEFLEGDPDRPIITGRVYNADCMPPYPLPDEKSKSTIKSLSYPGGGGFNELRFEDKKGAEQIFLHAERDKDERVERESKEFVGGQRHLIVGDDQREEVKGDKYGKVDGELAEYVGETISTEAAQDIQLKAGLNYGVEAGTNLHLIAGMNTVIEARSGMTLKCGSSFITLTPGNIAISSPMLLLNSGGSALRGPGVAITSPEKAAVADDDDAGRVEACEACMRTAAMAGTPFVKLNR